MAYDIATIGAFGDAPCECHGARIGDASWLPTVVWPSDVDAYKRKISPDFRATDATVQSCTGLDDGQRMAWRDFFAAWSGFEHEDTPIFGAANKYDEAKGYELRLHAWQELLAKTCKLSAPGVTPPAGPDTSTVKWIVAGVAIVALAYVASPLVMGARKLAR